MHAPQLYATNFTTACDANGNMTGNEQNGLTSARYDWRNLPSIMMTGSETMHYGYDGEGQRVRKRTGGGTDVHYIRGADGQVLAVYKNDAFTYHNIIAGGEMIGNHDGTERRYYLKDHLGSIRMTVSETGTGSGYDDYYPFGLTMPGRSSNSGNPNDDYKFTGHERDDEANLTLDYMGARYYDPLINRFLSIDPYAAKFPNLSPYNYAYNNPISFWDPDGKAAINCCLTSQMFGGIGSIIDMVRAASGDPAAQSRIKARAAYATVATGATVGAVYAAPYVGSALVTTSNAALANPATATTVGGTVLSALDPNPAADYVPGPIDNVGNSLGAAVRGFADEGASGISRALKAGDFGLADDAFTELKGTFSVVDNIANVNIKMFEGSLGAGKGPLKAFNSLIETAKSHGAKELNINASIANEKLYNLLNRVGDLTSESGIDRIRIVFE